MATTTKGFRYPALTDTPDVPRDLGYLAADIDAGSAYLAVRDVLEVGVSGNTRAGRVLAAADFTTSLGLSTPAGLFSLDSLANKGSGGALTNKGAAALATGITGSASEAYSFTGSTTSALYLADTGAADPFRIPAGSYGCWFKASKGGGGQYIMAKGSSTSFGYWLGLDTSNVLSAIISLNGTVNNTLLGTTVVTDDRWHFAVVTFDGNTVRLYLDGVLENTITLQGVINPSTGPFNIGGQYTDGATNTSGGFVGKVDEAFVTTDLLDEQQIRFLYAKAVAHGIPATRNGAAVPARRAGANVTRRKRGPVLAQADFTAAPVGATAPVRLYNLNGTTAASQQADVGSGASNLTIATIRGSVPGPNDLASGAVLLNGSSDYLYGTDTGLPNGAGAVVTMGAWFQTPGRASATNMQIMAYGQTGALRALIVNYAGAGGNFTCYDGANSPTFHLNGRVDDNMWHFGVAVFDPGAADGFLQKVYLDGKLIGGSGSLATASLIAASGGLRVGGNAGGTAGSPATVTQYFPGAIARAFIVAAALTGDQIAALYAKASVSMPWSPRDIGPSVEAIDSTNLYIIGDGMASCDRIDLEAAA